MAQILKPDDLQQLSEDSEIEERKAELAKKRQVDKAAEELKQAFQSREVSPQVAERINAAVSSAAKRGAREVLVLTFPANYCNDGGRSINNIEPDWPKTLEGFGKTAFDYFEKELRPLGFKLRAEIVSFPGGVPGDVGLYLRW
jgi:hypothetical protein